MVAGRHIGIAILLAGACLAGCSREDRAVDRERVRTPPNGGDDRRIALYQDNDFQVSRGARIFAWYGCDSCHAGQDPALDLADGIWRQGGRFDQVFASIADGRPGMPGYRDRMPVEPLWQVTAYVRDLERWKPEMRRRQDLDRQREMRGPG